MGGDGVGANVVFGGGVGGAEVVVEVDADPEAEADAEADKGAENDSANNIGVRPVAEDEGLEGEGRRMG